MSNYERDIYDLIPGSTPKEKYDRVKALLEVAERIAYPRRGTPDFTMDIYKAAALITPIIVHPNTGELKQMT